MTKVIKTCTSISKWLNIVRPLLPPPMDPNNCLSFLFSTGLILSVAEFVKFRLGARFIPNHWVNKAIPCSALADTTANISSAFILWSSSSSSSCSSSVCPWTSDALFSLHIFFLYYNIALTNSIEVSNQRNQNKEWL